MTSELAILNKEAIALAADSALTFTDVNGHQKIFNSVNKIFTLSKYQPVGIMFFGNAEIMSIPWETIIKMYRKDLGEKFFDELKEYASNFIEYLNFNGDAFFEPLQDDFFRKK